MSWKEGIDKKRDIPVYRQIIERITRMVQNHELQPGDKLPTERELAEELSIARGTVTRAYSELERDGIVQIIQGSGTYISKAGGISPAGRKEQAMTLIDFMIRNMIELNFSLNEIRNYFHVKMLEKENQLREFHFAGIDCNPEAMNIYENQLLYVSRSWMHKFLINDLKKHTDPESLLKEYDLILTTSTHYLEVCSIIPGLKKKIVQAAVSPDTETIASLATLGRKSRIGILTISTRFYQIISAKLDELMLSPNEVKHELTGNSPDLLEFLSNVDGVIIPPGLSLDQLPNYRIAMPLFKDRGGWLIEFNHQIERGSLIYLEEKISQLITGKENS